MWFLRRKKYYSEINGTIYVGKRSGEKALFAGGVTQSGGELFEMWESVSIRIKKDFSKSKDCLALGIGGGTFVSAMIKQFPKIRVIGIELDKVMIDAYNEHFIDHQENFQLIQDDATSWIRKSKKKFDVIMTDIYIGRFNPKNTRNKVFLNDLFKLLKKNGVIVYSAHYNKEDPKEFEKFWKLCKTNFYCEIIYEFPLNKVLLLTHLEKTSNKRSSGL